MKLLEGKVAVVTGAARGIGKAIALKFASEGADVAFTDTSFSDGRNDYSGKHVPYAPQHTLWGGAVWEHAMPGKFVESLAIQANVRGVGAIYWNEDNSLRQPFYALLDACVSATHGAFTAEVRATNITSTRYSTFYFVSIGNAFLQRGDGFGIIAAVKFSF